MAWELDGRNGTARIGLTKQSGFALMRDRARRLLVFHTIRNSIYDPSSATPPPAEHFVIPEDAFESAPRGFLATADNPGAAEASEKLDAG